jgi:hypothetical protein
MRCSRCSPHHVLSCDAALIRWLGATTTGLLDVPAMPKPAVFAHGAGAE